jgi:hypothetical protein
VVGDRRPDPRGDCIIVHVQVAESEEGEPGHQQLER